MMVHGIALRDCSSIDPAVWNQRVWQQVCGVLYGGDHQNLCYACAYIDLNIRLNQGNTTFPLLGYKRRSWWQFHVFHSSRLSGAASPSSANQDESERHVGSRAHF